MTAQPALNVSPLEQPAILAVELEEFRTLIALSHWTFARTMPHIPHEYTLGRQSPDERGFERLVLFIASHGYVKAWRGTPRRYVDIDGWSYWTMRAPLAETILINRARISIRG